MFKISIIMTVYNDESNVINAIESVINQTYKNWELIIIDDCSTDNTYETINNYLKLKLKLNFNISLYKNETNVGTFVSINIALVKSTWYYITRIDSDDYYDIKILEKEINFLNNNKNIVACQCLYQRDNCKPKIGEVTLMYKKSIIDEIGYYDSVRIGADSEFTGRIKKKFKIGMINEILYYAKNRINSLTNAKNTGFGSNARNNYKKNYIKWHNTSQNLFINFPIIKRPFEVDKIILP